MSPFKQMVVAVVLFCLWLLLPTVLSAEKPDLHRQAPLTVEESPRAIPSRNKGVELKKPELKETRRLQRKARQCDLVVRKVQQVRKGQIKVILTNKGPGGVPAAAYQRRSSVHLLASSSAGRAKHFLSEIDPDRRLSRPGSSVRFTGFGKSLSRGEHVMVTLSIVDRKNVLNESNTRNNSLRRRINLARSAPVDREQLKRPSEGRKRLKPDLTIKQMKIEPSNPTTADEIRFSAFVTNVGQWTAPASKASIRIGGETRPALFSKPAISPGSSSAVVRLGRLDRPGRYRVTFTADADGQVSESKEGNNKAFLDFQVSRAPVSSRGKAAEAPEKATRDMAGIPKVKPEFPFQVVDESMLTYTFNTPGTFFCRLDTSKKVDSATLSPPAIRVTLKLYRDGQLQSQQDLPGQFVGANGIDPPGGPLSWINWKSDDTYYTDACRSTSTSYCQLDVYLNDSVRSVDGERLDGDGNGQPGGQYHHTFYRGSPP